MAKNILIVAEQRDGVLRKVSFEVASEARKVADDRGEEVAAILLGSNVTGIAAELGKYGVDTVYVADNDVFEPYSTEAYTDAVAAAVAEYDPAVVMLPASVQGKDLSARLAGRLATGLATDCTDLRIEDGTLIATRPLYAGKCYADVMVTGTPQVISLRPKVFPAVERAMAGTVVDFTPAVGDVKAKIVDIQKDTSGTAELTEADIIVSGGRGMKGPENYSIIEELAATLGAAVGASRAAVDAGWRPQTDQVGQTGKTVTPNLYIACGISGAIQHLAGMSSSKYIVAVNKDAEAPIFGKADYGIVDDLFKVVPEITAAVKKLQE